MDSKDKDKTFYTNGVDKRYYEDKTHYDETQYGAKESFEELYEYRKLSMELREVDRQIYYLLQKHKKNKSEEKKSLKRLYKEGMEKFGALFRMESYYNLIDYISKEDLKEVIEKFKALQKGLETLP